MSQGPAALVAVLVGVFVAGQAVLLGVLERQQSALTAATWVYTSGALIGLAALAITRVGWGWRGGNLVGWALLAGAMGLGIVAGIAAVVGPLGLGTTLVIITGTQLVFGLGLDAYGVGGGQVIPLTVPRVIGALLVIVGAALMFLRTPPTS